MPKPTGFCTCSLGLRPPQPETCRETGAANLSAGLLRLRLPNAEAITVEPLPTDRGVHYDASLPLDRATGPVQISAAGATIGPFEAATTLAAPITITTPLPPGTVIPWRQPFRLTWTGGSADTLVRMRLINDLPFNEYCECATTGDTGFLEVPTRTFTLMGITSTELPISRWDHSSVHVMVTPLNGPASFQAPGLTEPGTLSWIHEYRFSGLHIR